MTLNERIARLKELDKKRTPGKWRLHIQPTAVPRPLAIEVWEDGRFARNAVVFDLIATPVQNAQYLVALANDALPIIAELEAELEGYGRATELSGRVSRKMLAELERVKAERDRLRVALEFYADESNYDENCAPFQRLESYGKEWNEEDLGGIAQAALAALDAGDGV